MKNSIVFTDYYIQDIFLEFMQQAQVTMELTVT